MTENSTLNKKHLGNILLLFTALIWGMAFVFQKEGTNYIGPFSFVAGRMTLSALFVGAVCIFIDIRKGWFRPIPPWDKNSGLLKEYKKNTIKGGLFCGVFLFASSLFQQIGLSYTEAGKSGFITAMYMLIVPAACFFIFRIKQSVKTWICVGIALMGMYFLCMSGAEKINSGDIWVLACAFGFSGQIITADRYTKNANPVKMAFLQFVVAAAGSAMLAAAMEHPNAAQFEAAETAILYCGLCSGAIGYTLQLIAQRWADPAEGSICMSMESVFAALGGALLLSERMSPREIFGAAVMFAAIILVQLPAKAGKNNLSHSSDTKET